MIIKKSLPTLILVLLLTVYAERTVAGEIKIAVASNFSNTIKSIAELFEKSTEHKLTLVFGSTGKHYAQIKNGAPFELFFAADTKRPKLLEDESIAKSGSRFTYAIGKVVLWSPNPSTVDTNGTVLNSNNFRYLSLANPKLAPYGKAAEQVMKKKGIWNTLRSRMVRGENIGQAFQFVNSGNAQLGFVAYSQIKQPNNTIKGSFWKPPQSSYSPIEQQAVLLKENSVAQQFLNFVKSKEVQKIIQSHGYDTL